MSQQDLLDVVSSSSTSAAFIAKSDAEFWKAEANKAKLRQDTASEIGENVRRLRESMHRFIDSVQKDAIPLQKMKQSAAAQQQFLSACTELAAVLARIQPILDPKDWVIYRAGEKTEGMPREEEPESDPVPPEEE